MNNALIVSASEKGNTTITEMLGALFIEEIVSAQTCGEARRRLALRDFDLVIVNAPLKDETGEALARNVAQTGASQVILLVKNEVFDAVSSVCEGYGVLTVAKPVNRAVLWSAFKLAAAAGNRLRRVQDENTRLLQKIDDIRIIDRAKCLLISYFNMSEKDAHRYIEKQAMDMRSTRREVAEGILKTYEN